MINESHERERGALVFTVINSVGNVLKRKEKKYIYMHVSINCSGFCLSISLKRYFKEKEREKERKK